MLAILPILVLICIILIGSSMDIPNIVLIGLGAGVIVGALSLHRYMPSHKQALSLGANGAINPIFFTAASVGFGVVITLAPGFTAISDAILNIPGDPLISLAIASAALGLITGSASGGLGISMEAFSGPYLDMGVNPEAMHRVSAIASAVFTGLPHAGAFLTTFALTGLTHEKAFKHSFITMTIPNLLALLVAIVLGIILY
jgi:H+/gluconate symporter-like permease